MRAGLTRYRYAYAAREHGQLVVDALLTAGHTPQRLRGFRPLAQREGDALDAEAQGLLHEFSDSEDSDDDMIDL